MVWVCRSFVVVRDFARDALTWRGALAQTTARLRFVYPAHSALYWRACTRALLRALRRGATHCCKTLHCRLYGSVFGAWLPLYAALPAAFSAAELGWPRWAASHHTGCQRVGASQLQQPVLFLSIFTDAMFSCLIATCYNAPPLMVPCGTAPQRAASLFPYLFAFTGFAVVGRF
jgi:hypothetical protein